MLDLALVLLLLVLAYPPARRWLRAAGRSAGAVWRPTTGLLAVIALLAAAVLAVREDWLAAGLLAAVSAALALAARRRARKELPRSEPPAGLSHADARAILGVPEGASDATVEAAYRRLIRMAHPDGGGTVGLAAQLNAARARLRTPRS